jgi:hypothetical protein
MIPTNLVDILSVASNDCEGNISVATVPTVSI